MCDQCGKYDGSGRKCMKLGTEGVPRFNTCDQHESVDGPKMDPAMLAMASSQVPNQ
jgi:hypothetical protein